MRPPVAATEAQTVLRIETALAKGSLTQVERRESQTALSQDDSPGTWKISAHRSAGKNISRWPDSPRSAIAECDCTGVLQGDGRNSEEGRSRNLEGLPALAPGECQRLLSLLGIRGRQISISSARPCPEPSSYEPRWKRCVNYVDNDLGEALGQAYVQRAFPPEAKQRAQKLVKQIEDAMEQDIDGLPWMSPATKQQALEKLHALAQQDRLSRQVAGLQRLDHHARRCHGQLPHGRAHLNSTVRSRRSASPWTAANGT